MAKLLVAEDDENLGFMIEDNLRELGHEVHWRTNGIKALEAFHQTDIELCILDIMMPEMDGFELARKIRAQNEFVPIIFLTAKSMEEDRLSGFEIGGDDYVTKPFSMKELSYRIDVFLRRNSAKYDTNTASLLHFGNSCLDLVNLTYSYDSHSITLTQMESQLLTLLVENHNQLVKREEILEKIWGENDYFKGRSLDVFVTRLRKYLKGDQCLEIRNHHGVGFCLMVKSA